MTCNIRKLLTGIAVAGTMVGPAPAAMAVPGTESAVHRGIGKDYTEACSNAKAKAQRDYSSKHHTSDISHCKCSIDSMTNMRLCIVKFEYEPRKPHQD